MLLDTRDPTHAVDAVCPVDWLCPLARGLVRLWLAPPGWWGGPKLPELTRAGDGTRYGSMGSATWRGTEVVSPAGVPVVLADYDFGPHFSLCVSFSATTLSGGQPHGIYGNRSAYNDGTGAAIWQGFNTSTDINFGVNATRATSASGKLAVGGSYVAVGTYDKANLRLYLGGLQVASAALTDDPTAGSRDLALHPFANSAFRFRAAAVYDRALSASEAAQWTEQASRDFPDLLRRVRPWSLGVDAGGGGDVTVALTGSSATASAGTLTPSTAVAPAGQSAASAAGAATPSTAVAPSGSAAAAAAGTAAPATAPALSGQGAVAAAGTAAPATTVGVSGAQATGATGTVTPEGDVTVALTGVAATSAAGSLAVAVALALSGQAGATAVGTVTPSSALAISGLGAAAQAGSVAASGGVPPAVGGRRFATTGRGTGTHAAAGRATGAFSVAGDDGDGIDN